MHFKHYQRTLKAIQPDNYHKIHHIFISEFTSQFIWLRKSAKMERKVTGGPLSVVNLSRLSRENLGLPCAYCEWIFVLLLWQWYQMVHWLCPGWGWGGGTRICNVYTWGDHKEKKGCFLRMNANALHVGLKGYCSNEEQVIFHFFSIQFSEMWINESLINR